MSSYILQGPVGEMGFCDVCGSHLKETAEGFLCPKCGRLVRFRSEVRGQSVQKAFSDAVYVIDDPQDNRVKVSRVCPNCGNGEALRLISSVSGEHAGVRQERTVDHFRCTKCSHFWVESS